MNAPGLADALLSSARTIAVVGYSDDPSRPSSSVSRYLRQHGYRVIPVNPRLRGGVVDDERSYAKLVDAARDHRVDLVDVFRRGEFLDSVVDDAIAAGIGAIWFQLGLGDVTAAKRAECAGLQVIRDRCTAIEHRRMRREGGA